MKKNADRFVHAIFCDDMRQEIGNKLSFMGCYQGELFVPFVPLTLAKICVFVTVSTPVARPLKALTIRLEQRQNQLANIEMPSEDLARAVPPTPEEDTHILANAGVMLSPFAITEPGEIRVVVITEEGEMQGPRLRIKVMPQTETTTPTVVEPEAAARSKRKVAAKKAVARSTPAKKVK